MRLTLAYQRKYYKKNKSRLDKQHREWIKLHPEKNREYVERHYRKHKKKMIRRVRKWRKDNPEKVKECTLRYLPRRKIISLRQKLVRYGMSISDYERLLKKQKGKCKICGSSVRTSMRLYKRTFDVDHDHTTGKVRGLLCLKCNAGLGMFRDDVNTLKKAVDYLK